MKQIPIATIPLEAIDAILDYNWKDEEADWNLYGQEPGHIFTHLQAVEEWLAGIRKETPTP